MTLANYRLSVDKRLARLAVVQDKIVDEKQARAVVEGRAAHLEEGQHVVQQVAAEIQNQVHAQIADIVSKCLEAIFDEPYTFRIHFERKRGRTEARLVFERDGLEVDPLFASGGGVVDVAAFALRLACLMLSRPRKRRLLVLDEPFRFVSVDLRHRVRSLLESLSAELGVQIVMVTHDPQLKAGTVIQIRP